MGGGILYQLLHILILLNPAQMYFTVSQQSVEKLRTLLHRNDLPAAAAPAFPRPQQTSILSQCLLDWAWMQ